MLGFEMMALTQYNGAILGPIAKVIGFIMNGIYEFLSIIHIENAALCIILLTFITRALMIPLNLKQQKSAKLSSKMNPEIQKVQAKYKGKKDEVSMRKQQAEMSAIYEKYGANPFSGCLPLLITFPLMLAVWRVVYNIPAYIDGIYDLYQPIANAIIGVEGYVDKLGSILPSVNALKVDASTGAATVNAVIDAISQFDPTKWKDLTEVFPTIVNTISTNSAEIMRINGLFGIFNIMQTPALTSITVLVPILAAGLQFYQGFQITGKQDKDANPAAGGGMMKGMNTIMPIMSGVFCLTLPIGVGLYWIAGSVFSIVQQFFVNRHMDHMNLDDMIQKNQLKAAKKRRKVSEAGGNMSEMAKKSTRTIESTAKVIEEDSKEEVQEKTVKKPYEPSNYKKSDVSYSAGSISANANLLRNRNNGEKGEKKNE